ncbi:MAG: hypothetical protein GX564_07015 [Oligosphaeraceae bacterium]|nr:hypothetical protein [Oligosphaeraceae bacterium]
MKIGICACQFYQRVPAAAWSAVAAACRQSGRDYEIIPDLCYLAAKDPAALQRFEVLLSCQVRAVRALAAAGSSAAVKCYDLQTVSVPQLLQELGLESPADVPEQTSYAALPQDWVPWFPVLDAERCVHCGKCADFCLFGVYTRENGKVKVVAPENCKTNCPACARMCPHNAIIFPKSPEPRLNGSLPDACPPSQDEKASLAELLQRRKAKMQLFREDRE